MGVLMIVRSSRMAGNSFLLNWDQHQLNSTLTLRNIWDEEEFLDVTLVCDDDQIAAHKVILSAASPFFRNILKRNPHSHPLLYIKGAAKKNMRVLLDFIYSGEAQVSQDDLDEFMALANSLDIRGLAAEAVEMESLNKKNRDQEVTETPTNPPGPKVVTSSKKKLKKVAFAKDEIDSKTEQADEARDDTPDFVGENEEKDSFLVENLSDTSMSEYDEKVTEMMTKNPSGWDCVKCGHTAKKRAHLEEHVQKHIEGYSFKCSTCTSTFSRKYSLRHHARRCKGSSTEAANIPNIVDPTDLVLD